MGKPMMIPIPEKQKIVPSIIFNSPTAFLLGLQIKGSTIMITEKRVMNI